MAETQDRRAPTIRDVAALAGVSKSTVSNVLRDAAAVSPSTRARVEMAIEGLGYRPNMLARQLVEQRTSVLGVVVGDLSNPFHAEMSKIIERDAATRGLTAMLCNSGGELDSERSGIEMLLEHRVSGLVVLYALSQQAIDAATRQGVPIVSISARMGQGDSVTIDEADSAELVASHLFGLGHRRVAFVTTPAEERTDVERRNCFKAAMSSRGLQVPILRWEGDPTAGSATLDERPVALSEVLLGNASFTAVFATNDATAIALLELADRIGVRVPDQLSIVGFDDVRMASLARISLTTVTQPIEQLGNLGLDQLAARTSGATGEPQHIAVSGRLTIRGTTARALRA